MEKKVFEKKLRDWTVGMGFTPTNASSVEQNYFVVLTATPNRRQLWEVILEAVKPRQNIEYFKKQLIAAKLMQGIKTNRYSHNKQVTDRFGYWMKQNALELEIKDRKKNTKELEKNILASASDLVFEIYKLEELKKNCDEYKEKVLVLELLMRKEKKLVAELKKLLLKVDIYNQELLFDERDCPNIVGKLKDLEKMFSNTRHERNDESLPQLCGIDNLVKGLLKSEVNKVNLWEKEINCKNVIIKKLSTFFDDLNSRDKDIISEKKLMTEKILQSYVIQLKRSITEKSLQILSNEVEGHLFHTQLNRMVKETYSDFNNLNNKDQSLHGNISYLFQEDGDDSYASRENYLKKIKDYVDCVGLKIYQKFLKEEVYRLENKLMQNLLQEKLKNDTEIQLSGVLKSIQAVQDEIFHLELELEKQQNEMICLHNKVENVLSQIQNNMDDKNYVVEVENSLSTLKTGRDKHIELFNSYLDIFRSSYISLEKKSFNGEVSPPGRIKQFISGMLVSFSHDIDGVIKELKTRKAIMEKVRKFISGREYLSTVQINSFSKLSSIKYDSQLCEKNFKDSDGVLWNNISKADRLSSKIEFCLKVLQNWLEQPYMHMITNIEAIDAKMLKEYKEQYSKAKIK